MLFAAVRLEPTADGSSTLLSEKFHATYHSKHGALQESRHVFIQQGLDQLSTDLPEIDLLEIGFGTGLNALLALEWASKHQRKVNYTGIEAYPVDPKVLVDFQLGDAGTNQHFQHLHALSWDETHALSPVFSMRKLQAFWPECELNEHFHLIWYDAFSPSEQPELWNKDALEKCYNLLWPNGRWVTYCAKGEVRRTLQALGMNVNRMPGPPFKRHMLSAIR